MNNNNDGFINIGKINIDEMSRVNADKLDRIINEYKEFEERNSAICWKNYVLQNLSNWNVVCAKNIFCAMSDYLQQYTASGPRISLELRADCKQFIDIPKPEYFWHNGSIFTSPPILENFYNKMKDNGFTISDSSILKIIYESSFKGEKIIFTPCDKLILNVVSVVKNQTISYFHVEDDLSFSVTKINEDL